jgi:hypothetical protein
MLETTPHPMETPTPVVPEAGAGAGVGAGAVAGTVPSLPRSSRDLPGSGPEPGKCSSGPSLDQGGRGWTRGRTRLIVRRREAARPPVPELHQNQHQQQNQNQNQQQEQEQEQEQEKEKEQEKEQQ